MVLDILRTCCPVRLDYREWGADVSERIIKYIDEKKKDVAPFEVSELIALQYIVEDLEQMREKNAGSIAARIAPYLNEVTKRNWSHRTLMIPKKVQERMKSLSIEDVLSKIDGTLKAKATLDFRVWLQYHHHIVKWTLPLDPPQIDRASQVRESFELYENSWPEGLSEFFTDEMNDAMGNSHRLIAIGLAAEQAGVLSISIMSCFVKACQQVGRSEDIDVTEITIPWDIYQKFLVLFSEDTCISRDYLSQWAIEALPEPYREDCETLIVAYYAQLYIKSFLWESEQVYDDQEEPFVFSLEERLEWPDDVLIHMATLSLEDAPREELYARVLVFKNNNSRHDGSTLIPLLQKLGEKPGLQFDCNATKVEFSEEYEALYERIKICGNPSAILTVLVASLKDPALTFEQKVIIHYWIHYVSAKKRER